jgi:lipopolysaccharide export system permease protein
LGSVIDIQLQNLGLCNTSSPSVSFIAVAYLHSIIFASVKHSPHLKKIDWYILKKFFSTFFFLILLMLLIILVIDYSERADDFVKAQKSFWEVLTQYYFGFIPHLISLLFHLFVFISVIFFTSMMANRTEIIPLLAGGVPYNRFLRPYLVGSTILALLLWWASYGFIPRSNKMQTDFKARYLDINTKANTGDGNFYNRYLKLDTNTYAGIKQYDTSSKMATQFFTHQIKNRELVQNTRSASFKWDTAAKGKWQLNSVVSRGINDDIVKDTFISFYSKNLGFGPADIKNDDYIKDKLTTPELKRFIALEKMRGSGTVPKLQVELYRRGATSLAIVILTFIGVFIASRKTRGGIGMQLAVGILLAFFYILFDRFSSVFAGSGKMHPALAAWLPNIIFGVVAIYLYRKAQK